ncbi:MAG: NADH-quinone oxidoreductase subunit H [Spirochaetes bacterium]|jgi:NADH-quinone oxidoreductase subunit H|nr:NADH-quinone oxidoreductase subunit H [Spirochaetota bacterium]
MTEPLLLRIAYAALTLFIVFNYGILLMGTTARIRARVQGRIGIPVWQPYIDIIKNNAKRTSISHGVMFYLGPVFRLAGGIGTLMFVPVIFGSPVFGNFAFAGDVLLVIYFIFFGQLGMALGAGEGGHPYSAIGVSRGLAQMTAFEVPFTLGVIALVIQHGTLSVTELVAAQQGSVLSWNLFTNPLATIAALIAFLGMTMNNPFSIVTAPQEIPIGPPTEYQSSYMGMLQSNRAIFNGAKLVLYMNLFLGGATNIFEMVLKTFALYMMTLIVGVSFPRFRADQSIRFFLKIPAAIGVVAVILTAL